MTRDDIIRKVREYDLQLAYERGYRAGIAAEREACAKVCDGIAAQYKDGRGGHAAERSAAAIRARSNT